MTADAAFAPGILLLTVGKPAKSLDVHHFHYSSGHMNGRLLRETAHQHDMAMTGVLQPYV